LYGFNDPELLPKLPHKDEEEISSDAMIAIDGELRSIQTEKATRSPAVGRTILRMLGL
jgi:hypothetical protein